MPKPRFRPLLLFIAFPLFVPQAFAQSAQPTDSLGGKTVHVYLPSAAIDTLVIQNLNVRMKQDAQYWYSYTFTKAGLYDYQDGFYFTDPSHRLFFSKSGLGGTESPRFLLADFQGTKEIWIIVDPAGPSTGKPVIMTQAPKTVNILNPWPATAPKLISGAKTRNMTTVSGHCGWFSAMLLDTTLTKGHFTEIGDAGTYGKSGFSGTDDFDFAVLFAQYGPAIWLNTRANSWSGNAPEVEGVCQYMLAMTVRDFSKAHPDFDFGSLTGDHSVPGAVKTAIGPEPGRKPVLDPDNAGKDPAITFSHFDEWWVTDSSRATPFRNYESCYDLPLGKSLDGTWEYESYRDTPDHGFWPAEGADLNRFGETMASCYEKPPPDTGFVAAGGPQRNAGFCVESHASFVYAPGQYFAFRGDDDTWVFIDGKLVLDLGGVHSPKSDSLDLGRLGLTAGTTYKWDFFHCDRQPCSAYLRIKTPIRFRQPSPLFAKPIAGPPSGPISLEIWKVAGGLGSCAPAGGAQDTVKASGLAYQLLDPAGKVVKDLLSGSTYYGGITIADPVITLDTAKLAKESLAPGGLFSVAAFEPGRPGLKVEIPFFVAASSTGLRRQGGKAFPRAPGIRGRNLLGRRVPKALSLSHWPKGQWL